MVILAPLAAMLVQMAISRTREYGADRGGAEISRPAAGAGLGAGQDFRRRPPASRTRRPRPIRPRRTCSSSTRCPACAWTVCSPPIPIPRNRIAALQQIAGEMGATPRRSRPALECAGTRNAPAPGDDDSPPPTSRVWTSAACGRQSSAHLPRPEADRRRGHGWQPRAAALEPRDRALLVDASAHGLPPRVRSMPCSKSSLDKPLPRKSGTARDILILGVAQLLFLDMAPHAVIDLAVRSAKADRNALHFSGLVNAVLRKVAAGGASLLDGLDAPRLNTPDWLWNRWVEGLWRRKRRGRLPSPMPDAPASTSASRTDARHWQEAWAARFCPTASCGCRPATRRCRNLPVLARVPGGFRMPPQRFPSICLATSVASRCSTSVLRRAARHCSLRRWVQRSRPSTFRKRGCAGCATIWRGLVSRQTCGARMCCQPRTLRAVGRRSARCALLGDGHHPPPPGTSLSQGGRTDQGTGRPAAAACCERLQRW